MNKILEVKNISKTYDDFRMQDVSFELDRGDIVGLIGKNGAGKTTVLKAILGLINIESGSVNVIEKDKIGSVIGDHVFYEYLTIADMSKIISKFYSSWNWDRFHGYLKAFKLSKKKRIDNLSKGMKVKFAIACALSHNAEFLILDEPTAGLDPSARRELLEEIHQLVKEENISILLTSHISSDIEEIANRIAYIREGELVFCSKKKEVMDRYVTVLGEKDELDILKEKELIMDVIKQGDRYIGFCEKGDCLEESKEVKVRQSTLNEIIIFLDKQGI